MLYAATRLGGCVSMKVEFESVLFGAALVVLMLISLPAEKAEGEEAIETASTQQLGGAATTQ